MTLALEFLDSIGYLDWSDLWVEIENCFYLPVPSYDVVIDDYIHSYWNYLSEVAK